MDKRVLRLQDYSDAVLAGWKETDLTGRSSTRCHACFTASSARSPISKEADSHLRARFDRTRRDS